jgi:hypothetical protein
MRVDDGEHVAAMERIENPGDEEGIEAAPVEAIDDTDTVPNEGMEEEGDEGEDEDEADDDADDGDDAAE